MKTELPPKDALKAILLSLDKLNILIVGYGRIGQRKAKAFDHSSAHITIVDPIYKAAETPPLVTPYEMTFDAFLASHPSVFLKQHLVIICTDDQDVNQKVQEACDAHAKLFNRTDDFSKSTFSDMIQYGDEHQLVAVSGRGISPYVSKYLMDHIKPLIMSKDHQDRIGILSRKSPILKTKRMAYEDIKNLSNSDIERI